MPLAAEDTGGAAGVGLAAAPLEMGAQTRRQGQQRRQSVRNPAHKRHVSGFSLSGGDLTEEELLEIAQAAEEVDEVSPGELNRTKIRRGDEMVEDDVSNGFPSSFQIGKGDANLSPQTATSTSEEEIDQLTRRLASRRSSISEKGPQQGHVAASLLERDVKPEPPLMTSESADENGAGFSKMQSQSVKNMPSKKEDVPSEPSTTLDGWTLEEDVMLKSWETTHPGSNPHFTDSTVPKRTASECARRWKRLRDLETKKGAWTDEEDARLKRLLHQNSKKIWGEVAIFIPGRSAKQCRERWCYNLDPNIDKGSWSPDEDAKLMKAQMSIGNKWAQIASMLPGRTENAVKTRFKSIIRAMKREWLASEDETIMRMHQTLGSKWDEIAAVLSKDRHRTKNAVKTRYKDLAKGEAAQVAVYGAPSQILRLPEYRDIQIRLFAGESKKKSTGSGLKASEIANAAASGAKILRETMSKSGSSASVSARRSSNRKSKRTTAVSAAMDDVYGEGESDVSMNSFSARTKPRRAKSKKQQQKHEVKHEMDTSEDPPHQPNNFDYLLHASESAAAAATETAGTVPWAQIDMLRFSQHNQAPVEGFFEELDGVEGRPKSFSTASASGNIGQRRISLGLPPVSSSDNFMAIFGSASHHERQHTDESKSRRSSSASHGFRNMSEVEATFLNDDTNHNVIEDELVEFLDMWDQPNPMQQQQQLPPPQYQVSPNQQLHMLHQQRNQQLQATHGLIYQQHATNPTTQPFSGYPTRT